jgi:hypothetical protein
VRAARQTTLREGKHPGKPMPRSLLYPRLLPLLKRCRACSLSTCLRAAAKGKTRCKGYVHMRGFLLLWSIVGAIDANRPAVEESWSGSERPSRVMSFLTSKKSGGNSPHCRRYSCPRVSTQGRAERAHPSRNCDHHRVPRSVRGRHGLGYRSTSR